MNYYTVPKLGSGTDLDPYRPDIPDGTSFVGNVGSDGDYLIAVNVELPSKTGRTKQLPVQALTNAANAKGISFTDVQKWLVG